MGDDAIMNPEWLELLDIKEWHHGESIPWLESLNDDGSGSALRIAKLLIKHPQFFGAIGENELDGNIWILSELPWEPNFEKIRIWQPSDTSKLIVWVESETGRTAGDKAVHHALTTIASYNKFNPLIETLDALQWDGKHRHPFIDYLGAEPNPYNLAVENLTLDALIMRAYEPGCKFDTVPVLIGRQGLGKSTLCRYLALDDEYFTDELGDIKDNREISTSIQGKWVVEFSELAGLSGSEPEHYKKFFSKTFDEWRPYYGTVDVRRYRRCVIIGSVNNFQFLPDETGNRRYLPVMCGNNEPTADLFSNSARDEIRQVIAEHVQAYKSKGVLPLIMSHDLQTEVLEAQQAAEIEDTDNDIIENYLDSFAIGDRVCARMIANNALDISHPSRWDTNKITSALKRNPQWEYIGRQRFGKYGNPNTYRRISNE